MNKKTLPYILFSIWWLLVSFFALRADVSDASLIQKIGTFFIGATIFTIASSISYRFAIKKYSPIVAGLLSFTFLYWCILYLKLMWWISGPFFKILLTPFLGRYLSRKKSPKKSEPSKSGYTISNEANIDRCEMELAMYEKEYEEGMRSPSTADNEYSIKIHLPLIEERKKRLKDLKEDLKRNQTSDDIRNQRDLRNQR